MDSTRLRKPIKLVLLVIAIALTATSGIARAAQDDSSADELYALAAAFYTDQNWPEAITNFRELIKQHPDTKLARDSQFYLGESLVQSRQHLQALAAFNRYLGQSTQKPYGTRARFRVAECHYLSNDFEKAKTLFLGFIEEHGSDPLAEFALPYLGELHLRFGDNEKSRQTYQQALERFPTSGLSNKCRLGLAQALNRLGQTTEAERFYRFVAEQNHDPLADEAQLLIARMHAERGHWDKAQPELDRLIREFPDAASVVEAKYLIAKRELVDGNWQASWRTLEPLLDQPMDEALFKRVAMDAAVVAARVQKLPRAKSLIAQLRQRELDRSAQEFIAVVEIDIANRENDIRALQRLVTTFEQSFKNSPHMTRCIEPLARLHYDRSEFAEAAARYQQLIELVSMRPKLEGNLPAWRYLLGLSRIGTGEFQLALSYLQSIREFGDNKSFEAATSFAIATALSGEKRWAESIPHYQKYLALAPRGEDYVRCHADLAIAQVRCDQVATAVATMEQVTTSHSNDTSVLGACEILAEAALQKNDINTARRFFQLLAKSENAEFASRGANGLVWSGDKSMMTPENLRKVIDSGVDTDLALEAVVGQVQQLQARNEHRQTIDVLSDIIDSHPDSPLIDEAKFRLAVSFQRVGGRENSRKARDLLQEFLNNQTEHELADLARYELAWAKHDSGDIAAARDQFDEIVDTYPDSEYRTDACYRASMLARQLGNDADSIRRLQQLISWDRDHHLAGYANYSLGEYESRQENWLEAIRFFNRVLDSNAQDSLKNPARYWLAESLFQSGNFREAENQFLDIKNVSFEKPEIVAVIWMRLAQCAARRTDWPTVEVIIQQRRAQSGSDKSDYQLDYLQGRVFMSRAKFNEAREMFSSVLKNENAKGTRTAAMSQWMIGESWFHQEDFKQALRSYLLVDSLYDYSQWRSLALLQAAKCHLHLGEPETARKTCERMLESFPNSSHTSEARQLLADIQAVTSTKPRTLPATYSK